MNDETMLDSIDRKIITLLSDNARMSYAEIAREINLSPSAVRERVQNLELAEIIKGYTVRLDNKRMGYDLEAFISIKVFHGNLKAFIEIVKGFSGVHEAYRITGNENVIIRVVLKNQEHLQALLDDLMNYGETHTQLILKTI